MRSRRGGFFHWLGGKKTTPPLRGTPPVEGNWGFNHPIRQIQYHHTHISMVVGWRSVCVLSSFLWKRRAGVDFIFR
jgi:hypothetical protein